MIKAKMRKGNNRRLMGEALHLWEEHSPEEVDGNPRYFDNVITDIVDRENNDPQSSAGVTFRVLLGDPVNKYHWADFMAYGVHKTTDANGIHDYRLLYERMTDWRLVDVEAMRSGERTEVRWNPGKKQHEVLRGGEVIFASADKEEAEKAA